MDRFIARENIRHFKERLEQVADPAERERLLKLLADEEAKLKIAEQRNRDQKNG
jgi:hypothetical protein